MNATVIIHPPGTLRGLGYVFFTYWVGVALAPNPMQVTYVGGFEIPVNRVQRAGIDRAEIAERICETWPDPKHA